jgi:hypothetical protein
MAFNVICLMFTGMVWYSIYQEHQINKLRRELQYLKAKPAKENGTPITLYDQNGKRIFL